MKRFTVRFFVREDGLFQWFFLGLQGHIILFKSHAVFDTFEKCSQDVLRVVHLLKLDSEDDVNFDTIPTDSIGSPASDGICAHD